MACATCSTVQLVKEEGDSSYSFNTISSFRSQSLKFVLNEEFDEETSDKKKVKCTIFFEGNKMIQQQNGENAVRIERQFFNDELITRCMVKDVVATRWFKAVKDN